MYATLYVGMSDNLAAVGSTLAYLFLFFLPLFSSFLLLSTPFPQGKLTGFDGGRVLLALRMSS
jgi:hypothetical protein